MDYEWDLFSLRLSGGRSFNIWNYCFLEQFNIWLMKALVSYAGAEAPDPPVASAVMVVQIFQGHRIAVCSGTLVTLQWVITAYSCKKNLHYTPIIIEDFELYVGVQNFKEVLEQNLPEGAQMRRSADFQLHRYHRCDYPDNNIMLIKVEPEFEETPWSRPPRLPDKPLGDRRTCRVWGYGVEEGRMVGRHYLHQLRPRELEMEEHCYCRLGEQSWYEKFLCHRVENGSYALGLGDFGAGLFCDGDLFGVFTALVAKEQFEGGDCLVVLLGTHVLAGGRDASPHVAAFASVPGNYKWLHRETKAFLGDPPRECSLLVKLFRSLFCIFFPCVGLDLEKC